MPEVDQISRVRGLIAHELPLQGGSPGTLGWLERLCRAATRAVPSSGAGVSLMIDDGSPGVAAAANAVSLDLEELQFTLGEGPCLDAFASRHPVLEPDIGDMSPERWPAYASAAQGHGVRAVFAFPLQVGAARLGVLDLYREQAGSLTTDSLNEALTFAEVAVMTLLDGQAEVDGDEAGQNTWGAGLDDTLVENRSDLYQAQGMVMIHLGVTLAEAMVRLRAYAYAHDLTLGDVARDVVARTLRLDRDLRQDDPA